MTDSSGGEDELSLNLSSLKRRCAKRSHISSDSDGDEGNTRSSEKQLSSSTKENKKDIDCASEIKKTPCSSHTPSPRGMPLRSSERLRDKGSKSFSLPSREKLLDALSPGKKSHSQRKIKALKPRKLVNNFLRERSSYVSRGEGRYDSDDSGMSDFIIDDDDDDDDGDDDESAESTVESDCSHECNKKDSGICSVGHRKKRAVFSSEEHEKSLSENDDDEDDDDDDDDDEVPLSNIRKKTSRKKSTSNAPAANACDSDESLTPRNKTRKKRRKIIKCSDSDEDMGDSTKPELAKQDKSLHSPRKKFIDGSENSNSTYSSTENSKLDKQAVPLRPRSRRVQNLTQQQEDKNRKMFGTFLKKRQTAKLDPKERLARKQLPGNDSDKFSSSSSSSSEEERDPLLEAESIFAQHSSELEEDEDDRNFIVDDEQSSDEGLNSDGASQFLKLLDTFAGKQKDENVNGFKTLPEETNFKRKRRKRMKKRKERKASKWRRIKMEDDSEDSDVNNAVADMGHRHPPLHVAVLENDIVSVNKLIKEDPDCVYELGYRKRTALHLATLEDRVEVVKLLLDHGADRTALDCYHLPAIAYAIDGHPDCVRLLLDHANVKSISKSMRKNLQEMNLLHFAIGEKRDGLEVENRARCLELLFSKDKKTCVRLLDERDARMFVPLVAAVFVGQYKCVQVLLKMGANAFAYKTDDGGNILHFAVECASHFKDTWESSKDTSLCLRELLSTTKLLVNDADDHGFTPLMYACESGNSECVKVLLVNGASVKCSDSHGTSSLHLAAMSGDTQCVQLLLNSGHLVDCVDRYGWPPLLYANFKAHESCVLALMKPKPEQVFVLGELLRRARNELEKKRTVKVVKNVLVSLANHDAYYTVFNDFIRQNPEMLDENNYGLLQHTWRAILDFDNKRRWFLRKLSTIRGSLYSWSSEYLSLEIDRENVLGSAMNQMGKILGHVLRNRSLKVTFKNEPGICTGPKREFFACLCKDIIDPKRGLFTAADDAQYSPVPNAYFAKLVVDKKKQLDSLQNTMQQTANTTVKQELPSNDIRDEELMSALPQEQQSTVDGLMPFSTQQDPTSERTAGETEELTDEQLISSLSQTEGGSTATTDDNQRIIEGGVNSQSVNSAVPGTQQAPGDLVMSQPALNQASLSRSTSGQEGMVVDQVDEHGTSNNADHGPAAPVPQQPTWISCMEQSSGDKSIINLSLRSKLKQLRFIGRMIGFAVCQDLLLNLHLSKPFVKQILGIPLSHPDDLSSFDYELHKNAVVWVRENSINELDLPFCVDALNPWNSKPVSIELSDDSEKKLTDDNKEEYVKVVSQLKLETTIKDEVAEFSGGLNEVIPCEFLSLFTADEFSLLIGGVAKIDVEDWKKNTKYQGCSPEDDEITWFWSLVSQLKEEEKALLMKFSTGSPCVPIGGFAALTGLSGATKFTILKIAGLNKIPMASTCFNMLKLTSYSSEKQLKDKLLIAIRHGAEGFSFG